MVDKLMEMQYTGVVNRKEGIPMVLDENPIPYRQMKGKNSK